jgi:hypothetical protein
VVFSKLVADPSCERADDALTTHLRTGLGLNAVKGLDTAVCWEHRCETIAIVDHQQRARGTSETDCLVVRALYQCQCTMIHTVGCSFDVDQVVNIGLSTSMKQAGTASHGTHFQHMS